LLASGRLKRRLHGDDRRRSVLQLSAKGYRIYDEVAPLALQLERELLSNLSQDEQHWLERILGKLEAAEIAQSR
jgi:DNA-binding MarR family transcriptional regulator